MGEKKWFFYVRRDRNEDQLNRETENGYWKVIGTDRTILRNSRAIGLKKNLVFYHGKDVKAIRTSWMMNEYRLPQHENENFQPQIITFCRVYRRATVKDDTSLPGFLPTRVPASSPTQQADIEKMMSETNESSSSSD
ncbi:hypothetical protein JRO89_XS02G0257000 [Xanthoceras sorbifolium]|uniref:NAC domain-containing protein n=1 Tax=Xanthoceras sorbifolium TaxID=99658 RepID=A0ABQ8IH49_9ROSI|nr:hypothetical protein JRO89_XS02G0257000 [Xanthoceras sorbifolium]